MRIVHVIDGMAQVSFGGSLYARSKGSKIGYPGYFKVSGIIVAKSPFDGESPEVIEIEGQSNFVLRALEDGCEQMRTIDKLYRQEAKRKGLAVLSGRRKRKPAASVSIERKLNT